MFKKTGSVVGHVISKEDGSVGGGRGVWVKAEDGGSFPPLGLYPCQLVYPQLQEGEREKRGGFFILLSELNNMSRIIFTVYAEEKNWKPSFSVFPRPLKEDSKKDMQCCRWSLKLGKKTSYSPPFFKG